MYIFFYILLLNFIFIKSKIDLPINFKLEKINDKSDLKSIFSSYHKGHVESQIKFGSKQIPINFKLTFDYISTTISNSSVDNLTIIYNINDSTTHEMNETRIKLTGEPIRFAYLSSDIAHFDEKLNERINFFLVSKENDFKYQGIIGLGVNNVENYNYRDYNIINQLKKKKIINEYVISFSNDNNKEILIIGDYPEIYKSYKRIDVFTSNLDYFQFKYSLFIDNIISGNETIENEKNIVFDLSCGFIEASYKYKDYIDKNFFNQLINVQNPKCHLETSNFLEYFYYCDKDTDISKMPSLIFQINSYNLSIALNAYNLFELINDKLFFLVVFKTTSPLYWKIGYLGLKKFNISFNQDGKTISFYDKNKDNDIDDKNKSNNNNRVLLIALICVGIFLIVILVGFIYYYISHKKNKRIANELDDDFVYEPKDKEEKDEKETGGEKDENVQNAENDKLGINE